MKGIVISDLHCPHHDPHAYKLALDFIKDFKPDTVYINGDWIDFASVSSFVNVDSPDIEHELNVARNELERLRNAYDGNIIYIPGNHEWRWIRFLYKHAERLLSVSDFALQSMLRLDSYDIRYITPKNRFAFIKVGDDLLIGHFDKAYKFAGYTAKNLVTDLGMNLVQGHTHRLSHYMQTFSNIPKTVHALESGCLCRTDPEYLPNANWQQGFISFEIINGRFYPNMHYILDGFVK